MKKSKRSKRSKKNSELKSKADEKSIADVPLEEVLKRFNITKWDFLLIGDGSGSAWGKEAGWACVAIERETLERTVWTGSVNRGTNNFVEMMAYLHPLAWIASGGERKRRAAYNKAGCRVHIITDSQYCAETGKSNSKQKGAHGEFWASFDAFRRSGIITYWHWSRRADVALNRYVDAMSKLARLGQKQYNPQQRMENDMVMVYDQNPAEE